MVRLKSFLFSFLLAALSVLFISGCSTTEGGGGEPSGPSIKPIDLSGDPFSLLGVYNVDSYQKSGFGEFVAPSKKSQLRVGLNLSKAAGGANAPEVIMLLTLEDKVVAFETYTIDLSKMEGSLNVFINKTFKDLGATLIEGNPYGLEFLLNPKQNPQYKPLRDKNVIENKNTSYLTLKLTKVEDLNVDAGLGQSMVDTSLQVTDVSFDKPSHNITTKGSFQLQTFFAPLGATAKLKFESDNKEVATVDNTGKVTILKNGNATIKATTENGKVATLQIKEAVLGDISLDKNSLILYVDKNNKKDPQTHQLKLIPVVPEILGATITYETGKGETVISVDKNGKITAKAQGKDTVTVKVEAGEVTKTATCQVTVKNYPEGIVFERFEYGVALNGSLQIQPYLMGTEDKVTQNITYSTSPNGIINIDNQGNITPIKIGDTVVTATYQEGGQEYKTTCKVGVYTPINIADPKTLVGTYEFVEFTSDSKAMIVGNIYVGTKDEKNYSGSVQRMIGEMSLTYDNNNVSMVSKIQMESSELENQIEIGAIKPKKEQLNPTIYDPIKYSGGSTEINGGTGSQTKGVVTQEGDMLLISQSFKKSIADVTVKVYVRKKSDTPKNIDNSRYFDYMDFEKTQQSNAKEHNLGSGSPQEEPYYTYGKVTYTK